MSGSVANSHRKFNPDPPVPVCIRFPESVWAAIDGVRGTQSRTAWMLEAVNTALYYEKAESA